MLMFVTKSLVLGVIGGAAGLCVGYLTGRLFGAGGHGALAPPLKVEYVVAALIAAPVLAILSSWLPAQLASQQDPAEILRQE